MKAIFLTAIAIAAPGMAVAQVPDQNFGLLQRSFGEISRFDYILGYGETPTTRKYREDRIAALRQEVSAMIAQDGGTLSEENRQRIARKVRSFTRNSGPLLLD